MSDVKQWGRDENMSVKQNENQIKTDIFNSGYGMGFSQQLIEIYYKQNNNAIFIIDPEKEYVQANPLCGCLKSLDSKGIITWPSEFLKRILSQ